VTAKHPEAVRAWEESREVRCDKCGEPLELHWPELNQWGDEWVSVDEYLTRAKAHPRSWVCCDDCLNVMPDAGPLLFGEDGTEYEITSTEAN
jgi:hypothetical protein